MGIITKDGLKFYDGLMEGYIIVEDQKVDKYVNYINKNKVKDIAIVETIAYNQPDVAFLNECKAIENVSIVGSKVKDYSGLYNLTDIKKLHISDLKGRLDLCKFSSLIELYIDWDKKLLGLESCTKLKKIGLSKFNPPLKNCDALSSLSKLEEIILIKSNIVSFQGLKNLKTLKKLDVSYLKNLETIDELEFLSNLKKLRFDNCKNIKNVDYTKRLKALELLAFDNCGEIQSISFIKELPNLKSFIFVGTNILDGDLSACIGLDYVGFMNKKHYSHKAQDFKK